jgi:hypothetical protein
MAEVTHGNDGLGHDVWMSGGVGLLMLPTGQSTRRNQEFVWESEKVQNVWVLAYAYLTTSKTYRIGNTDTKVRVADKMYYK